MNKKVYARSYGNYFAENPKKLASFRISFLGIIEYLIKYKIEKRNLKVSRFKFSGYETDYYLL